MPTPGLSIELRNEPRLCYAMQQSAVPWLHGLRLHNGGAESMRALDVTIECEPPVAAPLVRRIDALAAGQSIGFERLDPHLDLRMLANLLERVRGEVRVTVRAGDEVVAVAASPIEVLAYNEWPGLAVLPALLSAFVLPNHPALTSVLHAVSERLQRHTGSGALDGYQQKSPERARAMLAAVHEAVRVLGITYVSPPPSFERQGQKVRTPEQVLGDRLATCLDLTLLYAASLEHIGLHPLVVLQREHAFVGVWLTGESAPETTLAPAVELRKRCDLRTLAVVECTAACASSDQPFEKAEKQARIRLDDDAAFEVAIDVAACRRQGVGPLPLRTSAFRGAESSPPAAAVHADIVTPPQAGADAVPVASSIAVDVPLAERGPDDRLERWKSKLLDLTMFNRLLNFRSTKKTLQLCAHELGALEDRIQQRGRLRVHARPTLGEAGDPRDLELAEARTGVDVVGEFLAAELRAGRLRAEHDPEELETRLVEIYRHARTSLEESGANTLYLAIGFLRWFESPQSTKARRAPLLLLPLMIERTSVREGFRLVLDEAEPRINQTLLQLLERDFDLEVALDGVPEDDDGVDVEAVLNAFRTAALAMPRWEVETAAHVGFFSFTKYLMWLDLAARDDLLLSPVLRHLVETPGATLQQDVHELPRDELDDLDPSEIYCPKDADSSQLAAVLAGAGGRTFVLEGPPGTGKSQTITNLIAQALANDKRVLFVAEKRAALEVVQRRLESVGLGAFCLELHSSKSGPKAVLEQLRRPLELGAPREPRQWQELANELQEQRQRLNHYVRAIHNRRAHGFSVFTAISRLVRLRDAGRVPMPKLLEGAPADVVAASSAIDELAAAARGLSVPDQEPWWGVQRTDWSPALLRDIAPLAERLQAANESFGAAVRRVGSALGFEAAFGESGPSRDQVERLLELAALFNAPSLPPAALLRLENWRSFDEAVTGLSATGRRRDQHWAPLAARWRRELLDLEVDRLAVKYRMAAESFVLFRWWRLRGPKRELLPVVVGELGAPIAVRDDLERALQARDEQQRFVAAAAAAGDAIAVLGPAWNGGFADWDKIEAWLSWVRDVRRLVLQLVPGALQPDATILDAIAVQLEGLSEGADSLTSKLAALAASHDAFDAARGKARVMLELDEQAAFGATTSPGWTAAIDARVRRWLADVPRLREHCAYARAAAPAVEHGAGPLVAAHAHGECATSDLSSTFERTFLEGWLDQIHEKEPQLAMFRGVDHERAVAQFVELDRRAIACAAQVVVARLAAGLPRLRDTQAQSSELGILERELKKQRRHKPVRRLLAEIPGLLARLAPCVLMSPLSVAQFLGRSGMRFDLVVFDEASQIPMWDAVGAIGRGDSLVVVGDSRQLPPTTFFQRLEQGDEPDDSEVLEDLESVLDECGAAGLPKMSLDWHYRSRHESLIAFSNHHYYHNRLLTFPAPQQVVAGLGVRFVHTRGVYDRGGSQQNLIEAEQLVAAVLERLRDPELSQRSIGIVTFSRAQQVLIEDLLDRARGEHSELEPFFSAAEEPLFVKNLENVQGDERDTILFSICYGPDAAGKIYENYGPINQQGGERRLNVAVTRARRELVVFSSLRADQVATRTAAIGARHLRAFLDYAERGQPALVDAVAVSPSGDVESPFEAAVRDLLVARGHELHAQVGCSGYRIDLCVVDPEAPGRYLLGIECDGATYHSAATARDRDRIRAAVLRGLGWRLHRIWSMDFWQDPNGEIARVEAAIAEAATQRAPIVPELPTEPEPEPMAEPLPAHESESEAVDEAAVEPAPDPHGPRPYASADLPAAERPDAFHEPAGLPRLQQQVETVLAVEAPIVFDRLAKAIATAWGVSRVTERVRARVREALPATAVERDDVVHAAEAHADAFVGFRVPGEDATTTRPAEELPLVEVHNAMSWLLQQHHALSVEDLQRETARGFGITRLGSVVRGVMDAGIERLIAAGLAERDGDTVRLP